MEWWLSGAGRGESGELLFNGCRVSVLHDENVLVMSALRNANIFHATEPHILK